MIRNFAIGGTSFDFIRGIALIFQKSISPRWSRKVIRDKRGFLPLFLRHLAAIRQSPQSFLIYPSVPRAGQKRVYFRVPRDFRGRLEICKRGGETADVGREKWKRPPTRNNRPFLSLSLFPTLPRHEVEPRTPAVIEYRFFGNHPAWNDGRLRLASRLEFRKPDNIGGNCTISKQWIDH